MESKRKRCILLLILFFCAVPGVFSEEAWEKDALCANDYFWKQDYNAAWAFYQRALTQGCADGVVMFRAAKSFQYQTMIDDPELVSALYAAAHYLLVKQYPHDTGIALARKHFDSETKVNRRFFNKLYKELGGKAPKIKFVLIGFSDVKGFVTGRFHDFTQLYDIIKGEGLVSAFNWIRQRFWSLLAAWIMLSIPTGILLPVVVAIAVSGEGRKSYVTAYACFLHWGLLGIHRFYLGRRVSGLIWLLTGGLLGLGHFFDLFLTGIYVRKWNESNRKPQAFSTAGNLPGNEATRGAAKKKTKPFRNNPVKTKPPPAPGGAAVPNSSGNSDRIPVDELASISDVNFDDFTSEDIADPDFLKDV